MLTINDSTATNKSICDNMARRKNNRQQIVINQYKDYYLT
jgi:hypothetical protein